MCYRSGHLAEHLHFQKFDIKNRDKWCGEIKDNDLDLSISNTAVGQREFHGNLNFSLKF